MKTFNLLIIGLTLATLTRGETITSLREKQVYDYHLFQKISKIQGKKKDYKTTYLELSGQTQAESPTQPFTVEKFTFEIVQNAKQIDPNLYLIHQILTTDISLDQTTLDPASLSKTKSGVVKIFNDENPFNPLFSIMDERDLGLYFYAQPEISSLLVKAIANSDKVVVIVTFEVQKYEIEKERT